MKNGLLAVTLSLGLLQVAVAIPYPHIRDPKNLLQQMDTFMGTPPYEKAYKCGLTLKYDFNYCARLCEPFVCQEICDATRKGVVIQLRECSENGVSFYNVTDNKEWFRVTPEGHSKHSFLRFFLAAPWSGKPDKSLAGEEIGKNTVELTDIKSETFVLATGRKLKAKRLFYTYFHYDEVLKKPIPSAQSILMGKQIETGGLHLDHTFYEVKRPLARVTDISVEAKK